MSESNTNKIVISSLTALLSALLIFYFVPTDSPSAQSTTAKLINLDHPTGIFTLKYPSSIEGVEFSYDPGGRVVTYIGSFMHQQQDEIDMFLNMWVWNIWEEKRMIVEVKHKAINDPWISDIYFHHEPAPPSVVETEIGFTTKESVLIIQRQGLPIILPRIRISLKDTSVLNYELLAVAEIPLDEWEKNEAVWHDSFKSIKFNPDAIEMLNNISTSSEK